LTHALQVLFLYAASFFYRHDASYTDLVTVIAIMTAHPLHGHVVKNLRRWPVVALVSCVCMSVTPILLQNWVVVGSMNANFVFFAQLLLYVALAIGLLEYIQVALKTRPCKYHVVDGLK